MISLLVGAALLSQGYSAFGVRTPSILSTHTVAARHPLSAAWAPPLGRRAIVMKDGNEPEKNPPLDVGRVVSGIVTLGLLGSVALNFLSPPLPPVPVIAYSALVKEIKQKEVSEVFFLPTDREVVVRTKDDLAQRVAIFPTAQPELVSLLEANEVPFAVAPAETQNFLSQAFGLLLNLAFPLFLLAQLFGVRIGGGGAGGPGGRSGGPMDMIQQLGKSKSTVQLESNTGTTFADVAGCDGSKLELREVVDFLKTPGKFAAVGARAPRGVLLEGPPGTGKTLLARAVAGEAGVGFISASGSEFVEMFVGVGASRIRDLFKQAKDNSPCIIFIDEIDAIGRSRGGGGTSGGGNDEREQTLNQILTEMDGFANAAGVVVIAATNRADVLDSALLRPGRFDRRVPVELPDRDGRLAILHVHARDKPIGADVDLELVAARTTGFSGASLANLLNEAAIVTARRDKTELTMAEIEYALDRLTVGLEKRTGMTSDKRKRLVAYHEAGHAILGALTPNFDAVGKVTIVPRSGGAGGFTLFVPSDERQDSGLYSRKYLEAQLQVALGGRVAEELVYGMEEVTTGASSDLQRVADVARRMVTQWGFATDALGSTAWESPGGTGFNTPKMASEATQERIDLAVEEIVRSAYSSCKKTLTENRALLDKLTDVLIERETVGNDELMQLVKEYAVAAPTKAAPMY
eukprot:CAMPEP_0179990492 /NCGR_PEP_ID=MMETSP0984-20121128/4498_1 /TAXON_ID=483367 /ORGANISM="non described non described, Strain CCMP 2436" /LENGTH=690 /DNA_ID=CAMNT_0021909755 /DNA_START=21 /DNA_END=2093 /DNA_ORIENTATION=+